MNVSRVSARGQVVIPKHFRDKFNIKPNSRLIFTESEGRLVLTVLPADPVRAARGMLKKGSPLSELIAKNREKELAREKRYLQK